MSLPSAETSADPAITVSIQTLLDERHAARESTRVQPHGAGQWTGNFRGTRRGHGTDFDDLRPYNPGDELRHVDWKASARTNALHTRMYREEREHRVTLLTDLRHSMFTGTRALRSATACHLTARLLWQAIECGSRVCVIGICDAGLAVSRNGSGHDAAIDACALLARHFQAIQQQTHTDLASSLRDDALAQRYHASDIQALNRRHATDTSQPQMTRPATQLDALVSPSRSATGDTSSIMTLDRVAFWLSAQRQQFGSIIWVSALDHLGKQFDGAMEALSQATRQLAIHVDDDMLDQGLPAGLYGYRSAAQSDKPSRTVTLNRRHARQLKQHLQQQKQARIERFSQLTIPLLHSAAGHTQIVASLRQSGHLP